MKRIYIAGPYSSDNVIDVLRNIGRGQYYSTLLFKMGFAPWSPWLDKEFVILFWRENFTVKMFYDYSMAWLQVSDAIFIVPDHPDMKSWNESTGTLEEIKEANKLGIPIFYNISDLLNFEFPI